MGKLWRKSFELFREYPVLWLPCVCAVLLNLAASRLERLGVSQLATWISIRHSVLGGDIIDPSAIEDHRRMIVIPLGLSMQFITVSLFVCALVATVKLMQMIESRETAEVAAAMKETLSKWRRISWFTLKFMLALGALALMMGAGVHVEENLHRLSAVMSSSLFLRLLGLVMVAVVGWLLMPATMRLLGGPDDTRVFSSLRKVGAALMVFWSLAEYGLEKLLVAVEKGLILNTGFESLALSGLNAVVVNVPTIYFFIVLGMLACYPTQRNIDLRPTDAGLKPDMMSMHSDAEEGAE
jgi:hypothetical protein